jgi:hypothetical protein
MTLFLRLSERYRASLETFDPFRGDWLMRLVDPWSPARGDGRPAWTRIAIAVFLVLAPVAVFSAIPLGIAGGHLTGLGGFAGDIGVYGIFFFVAASFVLLAIGRRLLGALIGDLVRCGVADQSLQQFDPPSEAKSRVLRSLEWLSRVDLRRGLIVYALLVVWNVWAYHGDLTDGLKTWTTLWYSSVPTLVERPNFAGAWLFVIQFPICGYVVLLMARLFVAFACLCSSLARRADLSIVPSHPDGAGGLRPVGQVALFLSLFTFIVGVDLASLTANQLVRRAEFAGTGPHPATALNVLLLQWGLYVVFGSLLFFLPLFPLRVRMAGAKRSYLLDAERLHDAAEKEHRQDLLGPAFRPDHLQGLSALDGLMERAAEMIVWPFDKKTFLRYTGLLLAPVASFVLERLPEVITWLRAHLLAP